MATRSIKVPREADAMLLADRSESSVPERYAGPNVSTGKPQKIEFFTVKQLELSYSRPRRGQPPMVYVRLVGVEKEDGITPGVSLALALTSTEARGLASAIVRKADEADARKTAPPAKSRQPAPT